MSPALYAAVDSACVSTVNVWCRRIKHCRLNVPLCLFWDVSLSADRKWNPTGSDTGDTFKITEHKDNCVQVSYLYSVPLATQAPFFNLKTINNLITFFKLNKNKFVKVTVFTILQCNTSAVRRGHDNIFSSSLLCLWTVTSIFSKG